MELSYIRFPRNGKNKNGITVFGSPLFPWTDGPPPLLALSFLLGTHFVSLLGHPTDPAIFMGILDTPKPSHQEIAGLIN